MTPALHAHLVNAVVYAAAALFVLWLSVMVVFCLSGWAAGR